MGAQALGPRRDHPLHVSGELVGNGGPDTIEKGVNRLGLDLGRYGNGTVPVGLGKRHVGSPGQMESWIQYTAGDQEAAQ